MFDSSSNLPISGGVVIAAALYAGLSVFAFGPLVAERTVATSGWNEVCEAGLRSELEHTRIAPKVIPRMDCSSTIGAFLPELAKLCHQYGNPDFGGPATQLLREKERRQQAAESERIARAVSKTSTQCQCAAAVVVEDRAWALYAGSLRLITPTKVANLNGQLHQALETSQCAALSR